LLGYVEQLRRAHAPLVRYGQQGLFEVQLDSIQASKTLFLWSWWTSCDKRRPNHLDLCNSYPGIKSEVPFPSLTVLFSRWLMTSVSFVRFTGDRICATSNYNSPCFCSFLPVRL